MTSAPERPRRVWRETVVWTNLGEPAETGRGDTTPPRGGLRGVGGLRKAESRAPDPPEKMQSSRPGLFRTGRAWRGEPAGPAGEVPARPSRGV